MCLGLQGSCATYVRLNDSVGKVALPLVKYAVTASFWYPGTRFSGMFENPPPVV